MGLIRSDNTIRRDLANLEYGNMRKIFISALFGIALTASSACVYQANLAQGNLLKQEDLDQVEVGMTRTQVRFLLGTPLVDDPFHHDRWDYVYYVRVGRNSAAFKRWVSIYFTKDAVREVVEGRELNPDL
jgi:outer membrane protein assembly factor BamE